MKQWKNPEIFCLSVDKTESHLGTEGFDLFMGGSGTTIVIPGQPNPVPVGPCPSH
jgi:hypothetical protein